MKITIKLKTFQLILDLTEAEAYELLNALAATEYEYQTGVVYELRATLDAWLND